MDRRWARPWCRGAEDLPAALVGAFAYGSVVMVERFVSGTELAISVIEDDEGPRALPAVEIDFPGEHFDYESRYTAGTTTYYTPARLPAEAAAAAADLAVAAHTTLGLRDVSRTDAIVDDEGAVHFLEANVSPGLTETSMLPMAVTAAGARPRIGLRRPDRALDRPGHLVGSARLTAVRHGSEPSAAKPAVARTLFDTWSDRLEQLVTVTKVAR